MNTPRLMADLQQAHAQGILPELPDPDHLDYDDPDPPSPTNRNKWPVDEGGVGADYDAVACLTPTAQMLLKDIPTPISYPGEVGDSDLDLDLD